MPMVCIGRDTCVSWVLIGVCRDINSYTKEKTTIEPTTVFRGHTSVVGVRRAIRCSVNARSDHLGQDVDWNSSQDYTFASVGDDKMLMMYVSRNDLTLFTDYFWQLGYSCIE